MLVSSFKKRGMSEREIAKSLSSLFSVDNLNNKKDREKKNEENFKEEFQKLKENYNGKRIN